MKELGRYHDFNIRVMYYEGRNSPGLKDGASTDILLWNIITLYYYEYTDILDSMKESFKKEPIIGSFVINAINFVTNEMATFCNEHKVPDPRPSKAGEMIPLPIDEYPSGADYFIKNHCFRIPTQGSGIPSKINKVLIREIKK